MTEVRGACRAGMRNDMAQLGWVMGKIPTFSGTIMEGWTSGDMGISAPPRCSLSKDGRRGGGLGLCIHRRRYRQDQDIRHRPVLIVVREERREIVNEFRIYLYSKSMKGIIRTSLPHVRVPSSSQSAPLRPSRPLTIPRRLHTMSRPRGELSCVYRY